MATGAPLRLGTRGSQLALWQARTVADRISAAGGPPCTIEIIRTSGDRLAEAPLSEVGGKRLFVKEIEEALLRGDIDLAVHSSKDMPALLPDGLTIGAVLPREDPLDAVVLPQSPAPGPQSPTSSLSSLEDLVARLGETPSLGTGSVRRIAQLMRVFPSARFTPIRGNLDTRLRKLDAGEHDALVLAAAGLRRLSFASRISWALPAEACVPAPGQGIVAIEIREGDTQLSRVVGMIGDADAAAALDAERAVVAALGGGCQTPIGALATVQGGTIDIIATVVALDGSRAIREHGHGAVMDAAALGRQIGERLIQAGGDEILADARRAQGAVEGIQP